MKTIRATFSHGVFKPLERVDYPEDKEFKITIEDEKEKDSQKTFSQALKETAGGWKDLIDGEKLLKDIYESRSINTRPVPKL